jgi:hypothetical protein
LALTILTKCNAVGLVLTYCFVVFVAESGWRRRCQALGRLLLAVIVIDGWWFWHSTAAFGEPTGLRFNKAALAANSANTAGSAVQQILGGIPGTVATFFVSLNTSSKVALVMSGGLVAVGLAAGLLSLKGRPKRSFAVLLSWPLVLIAEDIGWLAFGEPPGRLLYPAIVSLAVIVALGWQRLLVRLSVSRLGAVAWAAGVAGAMATAWLVAAPRYRYPVRLAELPPTAHPLHVVFGDSVELIGFDSPQTVFPPNGGTARVTLYWRARTNVTTHLETFLHGDSEDPDYSPDIRFDATGGGTYPPMLWQPGEVIPDEYHFTLPARGEGVNITPLWIRAGMYEVTPGQDGIRPVKTEPTAAADKGADVVLWKLASRQKPVDGAPVASFGRDLDLLGVSALC